MIKVNQLFCLNFNVSYRYKVHLIIDKNDVDKQEKKNHIIHVFCIRFLRSYRKCMQILSDIFTKRN